MLKVCRFIPKSGTTSRIAFAIAAVWACQPCGADALVYAVTGTDTGQGQFGVLNLATGAFAPRGTTQADGYFGMAQGPNGTIYSLTYAGDLKSIDPITGNAKEIGTTGLGACIIPNAACGPNSALSLGSLNGQLYATDFANDFYAVNASMGALTKIALTGLPQSPYVLGLQNPDGTLDVGDEAIWQSGSRLFLTYDAFVLDPSNSQVVSVVVAPALYEIDLSNGVAMKVGTTDLGLDGAVDINGTSYVFNNLTSQIESLDVNTGQTQVVTGFDPSIGLINGAVSDVPEPSSALYLLLGAVAIASTCQRKLALYRRSTRQRNHATELPGPSNLTVGAAGTFTRATGYAQRDTQVLAPGNNSPGYSKAPISARLPLET